MKDETYGRKFFENLAEGSTNSARHIVPIVLDLLGSRSVIDVGCGRGYWLAVFQELGVDDVRGVDGTYVSENDLLISPDAFSTFDLTKPLRLDRRFDLVVSLEVAEHLPGTCAAAFIESLTSLGSAVLFSAAIPFQDGTHHVNEQWPEYWARLFDQRGFDVFDCLRHRIWHNPEVDWWYAQNVLLFVARERLAADPYLYETLRACQASPLSVVHPRKWKDVNHQVRLLRQRQLAEITKDLAALIPVGSRFILVDQGKFDGEPLVPGRHAIPFPEKDGKYWGLPADAETAIQEFERLREGGASFIVFTSVAFWWLDHYAEFGRYLRATLACPLQNDRVVAFALDAPGVAVQR